MAREIPQVVRAAAGLAATVLDEARKLPATLPGLPVRVVGLAMQKAMWLQQHFSGLVARGDEVFTGLRGEDEPGLATFDEDLPAEETPTGGFRESAFDRVDDLVTEEDLLAGLSDDSMADTAILSVDDLPDSPEGVEEALQELAIEELVDDEAAGLPPEPAPAEVVAAVEEITAQVAAADLPAGVPQQDTATEDTATEDAAAVESALLEADAIEPAAEAAVSAVAAETLVDVPTPDGGVATVEATVTDEGIAAVEPTAEAVDEGGTPVAAASDSTSEATTNSTTDSRTDSATDSRTDVDRGTSSAPPTPPVDGYDDWTIAQLRGRLRGYAPSTVQQLLDYEESTQARNPYLRMLHNRLERLQSESA